jgi:diaminopimelate epimerase
MQEIAFHKYEGLGNDFVLIEAEHEGAVSSSLARELCDRRLGVGGDGVLLVVPPETAGAAARMIVVNADGSIPEMCGNGLRCVAVHLARSRDLRSGEIVVDTGAGPKICSIAPAGVVTVDMGAVRCAEDVRIDLDGDEWALTLADAGNPHAVTTRAASRAEIEAVGPRLSTHRRFSRGTNVEFASIVGRDAIDLLVWERGVGITQACGTGACATVAVAVSKGWVPAGQEVAVRLPGGVLHVAMQADGRAMMRGPARHVFSGRVAAQGQPQEGS